jgi:hypothetical protein
LRFVAKVKFALVRVTEFEKSYSFIAFVPSATASLMPPVVELSCEAAASAAASATV